MHYRPKESAVEFSQSGPIDFSIQLLVSLVNKNLDSNFGLVIAQKISSKTFIVRVG